MHGARAYGQLPQMKPAARGRLPEKYEQFLQSKRTSGAVSNEVPECLPVLHVIIPAALFPSRIHCIWRCLTLSWRLSEEDGKRWSGHRVIALPLARHIGSNYFLKNVPQ
jgi:hypothetical protein